jgi:hypothetical protein
MNTAEEIVSRLCERMRNTPIKVYKVTPCYLKWKRKLRNKDLKWKYKQMMKNEKENKP